jgi:phage shock protein PspC (stress-responsive transcriptional regulator)
MNKILHINLSGYPLSIDDDAYEHLKQYLDALRKHFKNHEGSQEIISDIESRTAEIIQQRLENRKIVTMSDVQAAIIRMGTPEDFGAENNFEEKTQTMNTNTNYQTGKRLYKNIDEKVVGGVCSGLAAYFGINDPVWVRIAFVILTVAVGFGIPIYILLLIILPEAVTTSQKLEMRGEPIDVNSISKAVQDGVEEISNKITKIADDFKNK